MFRITLFAAVVTVCFVQAQTGSLKTAAAKDALRGYDAEKTRLDVTYAADLTKARAQLVERLQAARKAAIVADDLDEAQTIMAVIRSVELDIRKLNPPDEAPAVRPEVSERFEIITARWGIGDQWWDATTRAKEKISGDRLVLPRADEAAKWVGDLKPGHKNLIIMYTVNGKPGLAVYSSLMKVQLPR